MIDWNLIWVSALGGLVLANVIAALVVVSQ